MLTALVMLMFLSISPDKPFDFGPFPNHWTLQNTTLELALAAEIAVDVGQSIYDEQQCRMVNCFGGETNPFLPKHPTNNQFIAAGIAGLAIHAAIAVVLPKPFRECWQYAWVTLEGANVAMNGWPGPRIGLHLEY